MQLPDWFTEIPTDLKDIATHAPISGGVIALAGFLLGLVF